MRGDRSRQAADRPCAKTYSPRWWEKYPLTTLKRAEAALRRSWRTHHTRRVDETGRAWLGVTDDWFAANRVRSFVVRQPLVKRDKRACVSPPTAR